MPRGRPTVSITNPAASRLPSGAGTYVPAPEPIQPIRPAVTLKRAQVKAGPNVTITSPEASRESLRGWS